MFHLSYTYSLLLYLHCHWKPSQSGTVLKIAPCWPLAGIVYTAIIKTVWVLSIFDIKGRTSSSASRDIDSSWRSAYGLFFCRQKNAQEGTKTHRMQLHSCDIALMRFWDWNALVQYLARHGCSMDLARYCLHVLAGEKVLSQASSMPTRFMKASWASTARLGTILARFSHVYTATANRAELCCYRAGTVSSGRVNAVYVSNGHVCHVCCVRSPHVCRNPNIIKVCVIFPKKSFALAASLWLILIISTAYTGASC